MTLKDHEHVTTESRGEGLRRKVVIVPKVKAPEVTPEAAASAAAAGDVAPDSTTPPEDSQSPGENKPVEQSQPPAVKPVEDRQPVAHNQPPAAMPMSVDQGSENKPEHGNAIPKEKEVDDSIGNRV
jgi:hypothetical protein